MSVPPAPWRLGRHRAVRRPDRCGLRCAVRQRALV